MQAVELLEIAESGLNLPEPGRFMVPAWLAESHRDPRAFWTALVEARDVTQKMPGKGSPFKEYDFYYDLVVRHMDRQEPAFMFWDAGPRLREVSFRELDRLVAARLAGWQASGAAAGKIVCVIRPVGLEFATSVLAALKGGATLSILPPQGAGFLRRRLEQLEPDHIDTEEIYLPLLSGWEDRVLARADGSAPNLGRSHTYPSGAICALLFDPSCLEPHVPRPLTSDAAYLCALRDGLVALGLRRGEIVAAPAFHPLQTQPALLLASMLSGGTYLHLELGDLERDPKVVTARPVKAMGVDERVRDLLLAHPVPIDDRWHHWFRNPAGSRDTSTWSRFIETMGLGSQPAANLKWDAPLGGCSLFSARRPGTVHFEALPSAGVPWQLANPVFPDQSLASDHGLLELALPGAKEEEWSPSGNILARQGNSWTFAGTVARVRQGRHFPRAEVLEVVEQLGDGLCFSVCREPLVGGEFDEAVVLVVFTAGVLAGEEHEPCLDQAQLRARIARAVSGALGDEAVPDRIRFFPLYPRFSAGGGVDHGWCEEQYVSGALSRKSKDEFYCTLSRMKAQMAKRAAADDS